MFVVVRENDNEYYITKTNLVFTPTDADIARIVGISIFDYQKMLYSAGGHYYDNLYRMYFHEPEQAFQIIQQIEPYYIAKKLSGV